MTAPPVAIDDQVRCAERELRMRLHVYPQRVRVGKMTQTSAAREIAQMEAIIASLKGLAGQGRLF